jgi:hypothetical protein
MDNLEESKLIMDIVQQRRAKPTIDPMEEKNLQCHGVALH